MNRRGSVLIMSVWILAFFFTLTLSLALYAAGHLKASSKNMTVFKSETAFLAGLDWVSRARAQDETSQMDTPREGWLGKIRVPLSWREDLEIHSEDENSKLNINTASGLALIYLLKKVAGESVARDPEAAVKRLIEYRAAKPFEFLEELTLIEGFSPGEAARLKPYLTIYEKSGPGNSGVNVNTASKEVLSALLFSFEGIDDSVKTRILESVEAYRKSGNYFSETELTEENFIQKLGLEHTPEMNAALSLFVRGLTARSGLVRIEMNYKNKRTLNAVVDSSVDGAGRLPKILFWHESGAGHAF